MKPRGSGKRSNEINESWKPNNRHIEMAGETAQAMISNSVRSLLEKAFEARRSLFDARHETAFRLFNGFTEGNPDLAIDLYASTLILHNYADDPTHGTWLSE